ETETEAVHKLEGGHGILVPGGVGVRGTHGMIEAARFARERRAPYFGICFGMHMAIIEAARDLGDRPGAGSTDFGPRRPRVREQLARYLSLRSGQRPSSPPLRGRCRLHEGARSRRAAVFGHVAGRPAAGDCRDPGSSLVYRRAIPPGTQVQTFRAAPAVHLL